MRTLGAFVAMSGVAVLVWVVAQIGWFLSTAVFFPTGLQPTGSPLDFLKPDAFADAFFYFTAGLGSLAWLAEAAGAVIFIVIGRRILAAERKDRLEEQQAIDRILQSRRPE